MKYVYILQSVNFPDKFYVGLTADLKRRFAEHNSLKETYSCKYAPWKIKTYVAFSNEQQAFEFERYLKTSSGRGFAIKRL